MRIIQGAEPVQVGQGGGRARDARSQRAHVQGSDWGRWRADLRRAPDAAKGGRTLPSSSAVMGDAPAPRMPRCSVQGVARRVASMPRARMWGLRPQKPGAAGPSSAREMAGFTRASAALAVFIIKAFTTTPSIVQSETHQPEDFTELWRVFCIVPCYYSRDRAVSPNYSLYRVVRRPINQRQPNTTIRQTSTRFHRACGAVREVGRGFQLLDK